MAALTYFDDRNKVENGLLKTSFKVETGATINFSGMYRPVDYKYTRTRTKTYHYVGMDKNTAMRCVEEKKKQYLRKFVIWEWNGPGTSWRYKVEPNLVLNTTSYKLTYDTLVADIQATREGNSNLWNVQIQVNEVCVFMHNYGVAESNLEFWSDQIMGKNGVTGKWKYDEDGE